jgi:hypothetical protein
MANETGKSLQILLLIVPKTEESFETGVLVLLWIASQFETSLSVPN